MFKFLKSETFELLKYSFGLGSKIFTVSILINTANAWFAGNFDANYVRLMNQFGIVVSCVIVTLIYEKVKGKFWTRILASYLAMLVWNMLFRLTFGIVIHGGVTLVVLLNLAISSTIIYVVVMIIVLVVEARKASDPK
ncbi:MAG: hypothetical protein FWD97_03625 [Defluviitaleaceae bacterium]|nr:hypothetical protein [Defluviitaleaceae bacterium]